MSTNKPLRSPKHHHSSAAEDLLREERRLTRELKAKIKAIEGPTIIAMRGAARKQARGFVDFIREQSVVGLAIGLVLGTQMKQLVDSIVANFISPFLALLMPGKEALEDKAFVIHALGKTSQPFGWGKVLLTFISFVVVAGLVYATFKLLHLDKLAKKKDESKPDEKKAKTDKKTDKKG